MHLGRRFITALRRAGSIPPVLRQAWIFFWIPLCFFSCRLFDYFSERVFWFIFGFCILLAWSHYTRAQSLTATKRADTLLYSSYLFFFNVVTMERFFQFPGVGLRRRFSSDAYLFRLLEMDVPSRWIRHRVSAGTIWQRLGNHTRGIRDASSCFLCPTIGHGSKGMREQEGWFRSCRPSVRGGWCLSTSGRNLLLAESPRVWTLRSLSLLSPHISCRTEPVLWGIGYHPIILWAQ